MHCNGRLKADNATPVSIYSCAPLPTPLLLSVAAEQSTFAFLAKAYSMQHPTMGKSPLFAEGACAKHVHVSQ
jgi:hypothetical protein